VTEINHRKLSEIVGQTTLYYELFYIVMPHYGIDCCDKSKEKNDVVISMYLAKRPTRSQFMPIAYITNILDT
jgi:hypothetical protein